MRPVPTAACLYGFITLLSYLLIPSIGWGEFRLIQLPGNFFHVKWGAPEMGTPATVTYSIVREKVDFPRGYNCPTIYPIYPLLAKANIDMQELEFLLKRSFLKWTESSNLQIRYTRNQHNADILIGLSRGKTTNNAQAGIQVDFNSTNEAQNIYSLKKGAICFNESHSWKLGTGGNEEAWNIGSVLLHEIGHLLGLNHVPEENHVMNAAYIEDRTELTFGDQLGVQSIYGPRPAKSESLSY